MDSGAHIEWVHEDIGIIRAGTAFKNYGDPYEFVCMLVREGPLVHIKGAAGSQFTRSMRRAIAKVLREAGIENAEWERVNNSPRTLLRGTE